MLFPLVTGTAAFLCCLASKRWFSGFSKSSHARFSHGVFFLDQHSWNCSFSLFWLLSDDVGRRSCRHGSLVISTGNGASTVTIHSFNFRRESNIVVCPVSFLATIPLASPATFFLEFVFLALLILLSFAACLPCLGCVEEFFFLKLVPTLQRFFPEAPKSGAGISIILLRILAKVSIFIRSMIDWLDCVPRS